MTRTLRSAALAALTALAALAAILAADLTQPAAAQSEDETTGRIVARRLATGRVEFGWQPSAEGRDVGARVLPRHRYFPAPADAEADAEIDKWLRSSPVEVGGVEIGRINARLRADGRIEFAFTPTGGERILPSPRYFPASANVGRWLGSDEITFTIGSPKFTAVSAGSAHTCALRENGVINCWGSNFVKERDAPAGRYTAINAGHGHSCGLHERGEITCWGWNDAGQTDAPSGNFRAVSAGYAHTCAIRASDGAITCWGARTAAPPAGSYIAVSAGLEHTCGLRESGEITCWGSDKYGQSNAPAGSFTAVSAGYAHTCAIRESNDAIQCWGGDRYGETSAPAGSFTAVSTTSGDSLHTCAIGESGAITCWGDNEYGETNAPSGSFRAVSSGRGHSCGLRESGAIECWGDNEYGQTDVPAD